MSKRGEETAHPAAQAPIEARKRILDAAERLFAEKGYAATRVQEITDAAGVNKALLYYYFADKRSVFMALVEEAIDAFDAMVQEVLGKPGSYSERLREFVHGHTVLISQRPHLLRIVQRSEVTGEVEGLGTLTQRFRHGANRLKAFFAEATAAGEFRDVDPEMAAHSVLLLNSLILHAQKVNDRVYEPEQVAEHNARLLLDGFRRH